MQGVVTGPDVPFIDEVDEEAEVDDEIEEPSLIEWFLKNNSLFYY